MDKKSILAKYAKMIIDEVHTKTCANISHTLSGYNAHYANYYKKIASLDEHAQQVIQETLLYAVNATISNFLFLLTSHDENSYSGLKDVIYINQIYVDADGTRIAIVDIDDNLSGAFSTEWSQNQAFFKEKIGPESPRELAHIKVFLNKEVGVKDTSVFPNQQFMEEQMAKARQDGEEEGSRETASAILSTFLLFRFPNNHSQWTKEIEPSLCEDADTLIQVSEIAFQSNSFQDFVNKVRPYIRS